MEALGGSLTAMFEEAVSRFGGRPAIDFLGKKWSYHQLGDLVSRAARGLQALGVRKGDRVGLCLPNTPYSVIFYFATLRAGGTVVNFNPLYVERELQNQIVDSGTTVMVAADLDMICRKLDAVAAESGLAKIIICPMAGALPPLKSVLFTLLKRKERAHLASGERYVRYAELMAHADAPEPVPIAPDQDIAVLQYTGGTTGTPKGAMLTHSNVRANTQQVREHMPI